MYSPHIPPHIEIHRWNITLVTTFFHPRSNQWNITRVIITLSPFRLLYKRHEQINHQVDQYIYTILQSIDQRSRGEINGI